MWHRGEAVEVQSPLVSVVIPVWNRAPVLRRAITSVLAQSMSNLEVIVVDDGSTDDSAVVAAGVDDARIRVLRQAERSGASAARNRGIETARADLVAFLDSDDEWLPEKLERQLACLRDASEPATVVYCSFDRHDDQDGGTLGWSVEVHEGDVYRNLLAGWHPGTASVFMVGRPALESVGGFDERLATAEDYDLWLRLARAGHRFAVVNEVLAVKHERTDGQLTRDPAARRLSERRLAARWGPAVEAELGREGFRTWRADRKLQLASAYLVRALESASAGRRSAALGGAIGLISLLPTSGPFVPAGVTAALLGPRGYRLAHRVRRGVGSRSRSADPDRARVLPGDDSGAGAEPSPRDGRAENATADGRRPPVWHSAGDIDKHTFVFICGLHRSGTSMLFELLRAHPQISGFRDTGVPRDEGQHLQTIYPAAEFYGRPGQFGFNPAAHLTETSPIVNERNRQALFQQWAPYWDLRQPYLLEKSPPNLIRTRFLQALFPRSRFIVVTRHPVPVTISTRAWVSVPLYSLVHHWVACHETWAADRPFVRDVLEITYEGLVADPGGTLRAIADFLGVAPFGPDLPVQPDPAVNARYFDQWKEFKRRPRGRLSLGLTEWRFERRIRPWGYSFRPTVPGAGTRERVVAAKAGSQ
jgi:GT2 family glycosyltransferase